MYLILTCISRVLGALGIVNLGRLGRALAFFGFDILRIRRGLILRNLKRAFPEGKSVLELANIGRTSVYNFIMSILELLASKQIDITANITLKGRENIDRALALNSGVYVLCFHIGNWEAMGGAYTKFVVPAYVLVKRVGSSSVDRFISELRAHNRFLTVKRTKKGDGFKAIKEALTANEGIGFVMDQSRPGEPKIPFFGEPAKTNTSFAAIWRKAPAPIIPSYIIRSAPGVHTLYFEPQLEVSQTSDEKADVLRITKQFNEVIERVVKVYPEHYFWLHDRWK
jgi:Kdo2-lipid IVA lauroyltransferase/acyltransferase